MNGAGGPRSRVRHRAGGKQGTGDSLALQPASLAPAPHVGGTASPSTRRLETPGASMGADGGLLADTCIVLLERG